ncbi:hypothetical protein Droror1_Dr00023285 [Drosera rotundifolia]
MNPKAPVHPATSSNPQHQTTSTQANTIKSNTQSNLERRARFLFSQPRTAEPSNSYQQYTITGQPHNTILTRLQPPNILQSVKLHNINPPNRPPNPEFPSSSCYTKQILKPTSLENLTSSLVKKSPYYKPHCILIS